MLEEGWESEVYGGAGRCIGYRFVDASLWRLGIWEASNNAVY